MLCYNDTDQALQWSECVCVCVFVRGRQKVKDCMHTAKKTENASRCVYFIVSLISVPLCQPAPLCKIILKSTLSSIFLLLPEAFIPSVPLTGVSRYLDIKGQQHISGHRTKLHLYNIP